MSKQSEKAEIADIINNNNQKEKSKLNPSDTIQNKIGQLETITNQTKISELEVIRKTKPIPESNSGEIIRKKCSESNLKGNTEEKELSELDSKGQSSKKEKDSNKEKDNEEKDNKEKDNKEKDNKENDSNENENENENDNENKDKNNLKNNLNKTSESKPVDNQKISPELVAIQDTISSRKLTPYELHKLGKIIDLIPDILSSIENKDYDEIFGYRINIDSEKYVDIPKRNEILLKFLTADNFDIVETRKRIIDTLNWRYKFQPLWAAHEEKFDEELEKLGIIACIPELKNNFIVTTWNLYRNIKSPKELFEKFGSSEDKPESEFLRWRIGLMEKAVLLVDFSNPDNNKITQIHDYHNVSIARMDPGMKSSTKEIVSILSNNYPELLSVKFFINVPTLMSWIFTFFKKWGIINSVTLKKFEVLNHSNLSKWYGKENLPAEYNGNVANQNIALLSDLASKLKSNIKIPRYGEVILQKLKEKRNK